jgi:hypothetical protein
VGPPTVVPGADRLARDDLTTGAAHNLPTGFGRMFPHLRPFYGDEPTEALRQALADLGRPGGAMDAGDDLAAGPVVLATRPSGAGNRDHPTQPAGFTFLGQFIGHDLTYDASSRLGVPAAAARSRNERTPALDLDSLYGTGPTGSPRLYDRDDRSLLRIESGGRFEDVPREADGRAIVADVRNDENVVVSGLTAAMIRFHKAVAERVRASGARGRDVFARARQIVTWHYQWIVVHEYLPAIVGRAAVDRAFDAAFADGGRWYRPGRDGSSMPVELAGAALRFGHSQVRPAYRANLAGDGGAAFIGMIFDPAGEGQIDPLDLRGGARAPRRFVGWQGFFDFGDGEALPNKRIDATLSTPLFRLPLAAIFPVGEPPTSVAVRDLLRQVTWAQPSGQDVARELGVPPLGPGDLPELAGYGLGLEAATPLWYYLLREAQVAADGLTLGPAGARLVADAFAGILAADPASYVHEPGWRPTLPVRTGRATGDFHMVDLLTLAAVDPSARGQ